MAAEGLPAAVQRVAEALAAAGHPGHVRLMPDSARTAAEAAAAIGCRVEQIAKSILFRAVPSDRPVLVVASGGNRVDEAKVAAALGEGLGKANAAYVRDRTGFVIGGVAPIAHTTPPLVFIDQDLAQVSETWGEIWAAAGHPHAVFPLRFDDLVRLTGGTVLAVA